MKKIKKVGLVLRPESSGIEEQIEKVKTKLSSSGIDFVIEQGEGFKSIDLKENIEAIITLGGDGTFLGAVRRSVEYEIPIVGIHLGRMGFLAEADFGEMEEIVERLSEGNYLIKERMVGEVLIGDGSKYWAVNEVVVRGEKATSFVGLKLYINGMYVNSYLGDGLIVATPTGSTAYNLSAGGPIVYPFSNNFILTPIASHSMTQRPLVLPADIGKMEIRFREKNLVAIVDGQDQINLNNVDKVEIKKSALRVRGICRNEMDFFGVIKNKLKWGDDRE